MIATMPKDIDSAFISLEFLDLSLIYELFPFWVTFFIDK